MGKIVELERAESKALPELLYDSAAIGESVSAGAHVGSQNTKLYFWDNLPCSTMVLTMNMATRRGYRHH